jgi:hypothetical protein
MKLQGGNVFMKLEPKPEGWSVLLEFWPVDGTDTKFREASIEKEPAYDSFVVTVGELIAELAGAPE